ncbi:hypothetical protein RchiOBHm_Chr2g0164291 [Rosa chinensis]|uniref:DUF7477 domain-containing protein n=1 Tax=Rosa chinensis TaxID=74649 RepID=A0A2P6S3I9_ROSCH|nr:hypothetical protein RchiOBHm_Chr2g0164291 [Rosa chinensis]
MNYSPVYLQEEWIMEQWDKNYHITSLAGAGNGSALVVMSKGMSNKLTELHVVRGSLAIGIWSVPDDNDSSYYFFFIGIRVVHFHLFELLFFLLLIFYLSPIEGLPYTQQLYKVSDIFPFQWNNKKWKEGFSVTSMTTAGSRWGIVMSRNAGYSNQVVEIDFLYPSEGIHGRWENGYRIYLNCCNRGLSN